MMSSGSDENQCSHLVDEKEKRPHRDKPYMSVEGTDLSIWEYLNRKAQATLARTLYVGPPWANATKYSHRWAHCFGGPSHHLFSARFVELFLTAF